MKMGEKLKKVIAFVMSVAMVICMCPLSHEIYAEGNDDNFKIQVLQKEIPIADIECYLTNNDEGNLLSDTGMTDSDGIWVTKYSLEELDGTEIELTIDGKKRTVTFNSESRQYLLVELSNFEQTRWEEKAVETEILESIDGLESLIVDNGTKIEVLKDKLPVSVHMNTSTKKHDVAQVEWDYSTIKYDVNCKSEEQKFNVSGKVKIPEGVKVSEESLLDVILHITVKKYPDAEFTIEPKDVVLNVGDELNLSASAKNADENTYRWYRDGQEVTGAVGQSIHIDNVSLKDSGIYTCKVMGLNGTEVETREVKVSINKILSDNMMLAMKDSASTTQTRPIEKVGIQVINLNQDATGTLTYTVRVKSDNSIIAELTKDAGTGREYIFEIPKTAVNDYVFSVKYSGDEKYEGAESSLEFHMEKGMQSKLELGIPESIKLADKSSELPNLEVSGGDGSGNYIYSIGEEYDIVGNKLEGTNNIAEINKDGTGLIIKRSGKFQIVIYREGDNDYNESKPVSVTIEVGKKQQSGFRFEKEPKTLIYENGLTYTNKAVGIESSNQEVEYEIVEGKDVADIQDETLKIKKAGTVTVRAIHSGDDIYAAAEAEYKITIERAKQQVQFENVASNKIKYGTISYKNKAFSSQTDSKGEVSYIIISGEDIAEINQNSGELTFKDGKTGMVVVKASIAKCERYEEAASEYCVEVEENICPENAYIIEGESKNGWYRSDITIKPKEGYLIGKSNALNADFSDKIVVENEGKNNGFDIYLKDKEDGSITLGTTIDSSNLKIDKTGPENLMINYEEPKGTFGENITYGYYQSTVTVTISATDSLSGIESMRWEYHSNDTEHITKLEATEGEFDKKSLTYSEDGTEASAEITLRVENVEDLKGNIIIKASDYAGHDTTTEDSRYVVVFDNISPTTSVSYSQADRVVDADTLKDVEAYDYSSEGRYKLYYKEEATATITVDEANFYPEDVHITVKNVETEEERVVKSNELDWEQIADTDKWIGNIKIEENGDYLILMTYSDRSTNEMKEYLSPYIMIDDNKPKISVVYDNNEAVNGKYYAQARTAKITVEEHNFRAEDVETLVLAKDVTGKDVDVKDYAAYLKDRESWVSEGDIHTATVTFDEDAQYDFVINYSDLRGNLADTYDADMEDTELDNGEVSPDNVSAFVIDKTAPAKEEIRVSYSESLLDKFLEGITFGYYNPSVTVKITAEDDTSGIDYISWYYEKESGVSSINREKENGTIKNTDVKFTNSYDKKISSIEFTLTADEAKQYRGKISAVVTDKAGNHSDEYKDSHRVVVVDTISPTRTVSFSNAEQVVNAKTLKTVDKYNYSTEGNKYKLYYQSQAIVTFSVNEANFYPEDVEIKFNGQKVRAEKWKKWKDDNWTSSITIAKEGHYVVTMDYKDRSNNKMKSYTSNEIIIDKTRPAIDVEYSEDNVIRTVKGRKYYDKKQTAMITITEHNFRADDVEVVVKAKDITGNDIKVMDFAKYLKNRGNWKSNGDVHTAKIAYTKNANYTFDVKYKDLSNRNILRYKSDKFTVDKTNPANLKVSYSTNIFENVLNSVTFGFYNAQMTVTIQADDNISGIHKFVYSYENAKGVSKRNAELIDKALTNARITYINDGKTAVAKFNIPKNTLKGDNQFRGKVRFTAYDRSDNSSDKEEKKTVVVDNIAPQGNVTLNKPVASNNGISYYTGNITATIQINEANFYPEDVSIKVNGASRRAEKWTQNGDNWTGIVTISGDGHYKLNVDYKDRSQNKMKSYQSNELTIDSRKPTIMVQGIKNNSANKKDKIGFTIVSKDENLNSGAFDAELSAVYKTGDGKFKTKIIDIGKGVLSDKGKTHSYVIDNLKEDAVYTLKCKAADYAGNSIDTFTISDSGNEQSKNLSFSVNRKGSAFMLDDYAKQIVDNYYNQSVDGDIKIVEINVDPLRSYKVELNNRELREGIDYTVSKSEGKGKWCRYEYSIKSSLFQEENNYSVIVTSTDKTKTVAYSDIKKAEISFVIDKTSPVLTVSGMEKNGRYQTDSQTVTIIPTDDGGKLSSVIVEVTDRDGKIINTPFDLTGDSLENTLEKDSNKLIFHLKEGMYQNVIITCKDKAGNSYSSKETFYNITVSPSAFVIFWTNTLLRWVVIIGLVLIVSGILWIILRKRKAKTTTK